MSWFARSISNTLNFDEPEEHDLDEINKHSTAVEQIGDEQQPDSPGRGVKEDLSELTKTLSRQFWGVASFLAPPPPSEHSPPSDSKPHEPSDAVFDPDSSEPEAISGIRNDFAEIGGRFRSGISKLSSNIAVSEITKMASTFLQLGPEEGDYDTARGAVGVTDEVVAFVRDIAMHPERWLDFPLSEDEDDEDFDLSDAQQEHALAVERLAPQLAALRIELCPGYMSEGSFWKIYFVLLHPKLDSHDAELLLTHEIVKARASLTHELQNSQAYPEQDGLKRDTSYLKDMSAPREESLFVPSNVQSESLGLADPTLSSAKSTLSADGETDKHPVLSNEIQIIDKSVIEERLKNQPKDQSASSSNVSEPKDEDDGDDWLKEESTEIVGSSRNTIPIENDEDVSFSDLEEEDDGDVPTSDMKVTYGSDSSTKDSRDWVQLGKSSAGSTKESND